MAKCATEGRTTRPRAARLTRTVTAWCWCWCSFEHERASDAHSFAGMLAFLEMAGNRILVVYGRLG